jgi:hypothetical protein
MEIPQASCDSRRRSMNRQQRCTKLSRASALPASSGSIMLNLTEAKRAKYHDKTNPGQLTFGFNGGRLVEGALKTGRKEAMSWPMGASLTQIIPWPPRKST